MSFLNDPSPSQTENDRDSSPDLDDGYFSDPFDIASTENASIDERLRRWRQAALKLNASRRFRYTLDLKKEEEKKQIRRKIRAHAQAIRAALLFKAAGDVKSSTDSASHVDKTSAMAESELLGKVNDLLSNLWKMKQDSDEIMGSVMEHIKDRVATFKNHLTKYLQTNNPYLYPLNKAADYLGIKSLFHLTSRAMGDTRKGRSVEDTSEWFARSSSSEILSPHASSIKDTSHEEDDTLESLGSLFVAIKLSRESSVSPSPCKASRVTSDSLGGYFAAECLGIRTMVEEFWMEKHNFDKSMESAVVLVEGIDIAYELIRGMVDPFKAFYQLINPLS